MANGFAEIGTSGLERFAGYITEEEFLPGLHGRQAIRVYKEMRENDPAVGAAVFVFDNLIRGVEWWDEPNSNDDEDVEIAEFFTSCREDMSMTWEDLISENLSMLEYGWAFHEIVYKRRNGPNENDGSRNSKFNDSRIGWRKIPLRSQETLDRWDIDEKDGGIQGMIQRAAPDYKERTIPMRNGLLFRTTTRKNNPEGRSLLRNAYRPWYYKKRIEEIEGVGIERDLAGLPMAYVDPDIMTKNATAEQKQVYNAIKDIVTKVRRDAMEGVIFPRQYDDQGNLLYEFTLLSAGGQRQFDTSRIIERKNREILITIAADFIVLGHEGVGSYALSTDKTNMFQTAIETFLDIIASVYNRFAYPRLAALNGFPLDKLPELKHGKVGKPDLSVIGSFLSALTGAGMTVFTDTKTQEWARKIADMPELSEEEKREIEVGRVPVPPAPRTGAATNGQGDGSVSEDNEVPS